MSRKSCSGKIMKLRQQDKSQLRDGSADGPQSKQMIQNRAATGSNAAGGSRNGQR